jgi:hypothetical protein
VTTLSMFVPGDSARIEAAGVPTGATPEHEYSGCQANE